MSEWGWPQKYYGGGVVDVWHFDDGTVFVGGFTEGKLTDYAHFDADRRLLSGTIPAYQTRLYLTLRTLFDPNYQEHIYDTGSGFYIYTAILPDGCLLFWPSGFPGALDGSASDCFSPEY